MADALPAHVVLVLGSWLNGREASLMRRRITDRYQLNAHQISYRVARAGLEKNIDVLRGFVVDDVRPRDGAEVHFIAHGLGAIIALAMLAQWPAAPTGQVVCLGAPLGSADAMRRLAALAGDDGLMRQSLARFELDWGALGHRKIGAVAGTLGAKHRCDSLPEPNDGSVSVEETRADALTDHVRLAATHTELLTSREVIDQTVHFIRHSGFDRSRKHELA